MNGYQKNKLLLVQLSRFVKLNMMVAQPLDFSTMFESRGTDIALHLPPIDTADGLPSTMDFYGANRLLADYCQCLFKEVVPKLSWQHGWKPSGEQWSDPLLLIMEPTLDRSKTFLVARQDEQNYLRRAGLNAHAIGLPYVYAAGRQLATPSPARYPNSLLVMPAHSLEYTTHQWKFDAYADAILQIRDQFDSVAVCVHPSCAQKNYWLPQFKKRGIQLIFGADVHDRNGLVRVKSIMDQFEFMTTNALGSHVVYAAASKVKVSIFGEYAAYRAADFANSEYYQRNPSLLASQLDAISEGSVRAKYPELFSEPSQAIDRTDWARDEIGWDCRLSVSAVEKLLGWDLRSKTTRKFRRFCRNLTRGPERLVKSLIS